MSEQLYNLIQSVPDAASAYVVDDDVGVVAALNAETVQHKDATRRKSTWVITTFSADDARLILNGLKVAAASDPIVEAAYHELTAGDGLDLSLELTQQFIETVGTATGWPDELKAAVKGAGVWSTSPAADVLRRDSVLADVAAAREWHAVLGRLDRVTSDALRAVHDGVATTWAEVETILTTEPV